MTTVFYLGVPIEVETYQLHAMRRGWRPAGWIWATWPDGRRFRHWTPQLTTTAWGETVMSL